ncbi:MAG: HAMP domain-containing protein [Candidatus Obscuribacterales bacterium]|jgi:hypothetical protein
MATVADSAFQVDARPLLKALRGVKRGDFSTRMPLDATGVSGEVAEAFNDVVELNERLLNELQRIGNIVGREGKITHRAQLGDAGGCWAKAIIAVNTLVGDLVRPTTEVARVIGSVAKGDLGQTMSLEIEGTPLKGEFLRTAKTINTMVEQLGSFASEVTRVAKEVGTEGKLGGQAQVKGVSGTWKDLTDSVNSMASNLTAQVRNIAEVTTAVATGDLSKKITVDVKGEILELKNTINTMVDQLGSFASEVTRVAREVGTDGKLGGQAQVKGVSGTWKDLTDNVNSMASNLTAQVRNIADVTTAVANGDLSKKITVDVKGEILELKITINTMVDQLGSFASEVTRVAREVGTDGKLGGQAKVKGVAGTWKDLTDSVNYMASNLTSQVRNIAEVTTAVANGDLSKKITVDVKGEILELKITINTMVDQLSSFASEVTRVAREVGTEGNLGGQAQVKGVSGTWKDLTDNVNSMAGNLTDQVRNIADVTTAVARGDLSKKITVDVKGEILELKNTINTMVDQLSSFAAEVTRVAREVGTEGKLGGQAYVKGVSGTWKDLTDNVNSMAGNLTGQVRNIAEVTTAVANGDLSKKITVDVQGEILELKNTINTMVDQLSSFASEVTRVAREVGTEGKLGGQAQVSGVGGIWKDLTDNVNSMAGNLTGQVRGIAVVVTAVANGDLNRKLVLKAKGEIAALSDTINEMIDTLATFADQVTSVAREVGVEGKLGGQAKVPGAAGTWRDLTDNVNQLAANLTTQVRAIADVATAVTKGDLTRSISVEALGEVASLKDNINEMIFNLKDTTRKNTEQDWLKTNLTKFTRMLQGQRDLLTVASLILSEVSPLVSAQHGVFYICDHEGGEDSLKLIGSYAYRTRKNLGDRFRMGESLIGQCALEKQRILLQHVPEDYVHITSGLGESAPRNIVVLPVLFEGQVRAVIELASLQEFNDTHLNLLDQLTESIGIVLNTIEANTRTEDLLRQSQSLAHELQNQQQELTETNKRLESQAQTLRQSEVLLTEQQEELRQTNQQLQEKAELLAIQNKEVEQNNREIETARITVEEKAKQLALTSKYKSEFLANMSHELRTPLNSLLILSRLLAENDEGNLTPDQVEYAETVHAAGSELLLLINDILDLSKIESGNMTLDLGEVFLTDLRDDMERGFKHVAENKDLSFTIELEPGLPQSLYTDGKRLNQILKNLLSNAFKFTATGGVTLAVRSVPGLVPELAFSVSDTGIGISEDKQQIIFEAFQQADGTTSRKYGGTGLGLAISREIASLLGGRLIVNSAPGHGSTFTFFISANTAMGSSEELARDDYERRRKTVLERLVNRTPVQTGPVEDDRNNIVAGDKVVLIVEDDLQFAKLLRQLAAVQNLKSIVTASGEEGVYLAGQFKPLAITLDLHLVDGWGWTVLDQLKHNLTTKNIPVHLISIDSEDRKALRLGAHSFIQKPVTKETLEEVLASIADFKQNPEKHVLVVDPNPEHQRELAALLGGDLSIHTAKSASEAIEAIGKQPIDYVVTAFELPDMSGFDFIKETRKLKSLPIVVHSPIKLSSEQEEELVSLHSQDALEAVLTMDQVCQTLLKNMRIDTSTRSNGSGNGKSAARITANNLPQSSSGKNAVVYDTSLANRTILIVDDDPRNIMAMKYMLAKQNLKILQAEDGRKGIEMLEANPDVECILMDIMMPNMNGYQAIREIRKQTKYTKLPIIALTAKAMIGDREKCLDAGASDYMAKPVDYDRLLSLLRVWLYN